MLIRHFFLAILMVMIWGCNFIFINLGLQEIAPLWFCTLRFFLASIPAIFFFKWPRASFRTIILYGLLTFGLQFSFLFVGMHTGMPPGLASLLSQLQVFFSIFFAAVILDETPHGWQIVGALIAFAGIAIIGMHLDADTTPLGFICMIASALSWGLGNLVTRRANQINMMALVVWGSFIACIPLLVISILFEGINSIIDSIQHLSWLGSVSIIYVVYASTWVGYGIWNWLLSRYPIATIVPFTLLVPLIAMLSSVLILNEPLQSWKLMAGALVMMGLGINLLGARLIQIIRHRR